jgi:hypothetical protein
MRMGFDPSKAVSGNPFSNQTQNTQGSEDVKLPGQKDFKNQVAYVAGWSDKKPDNFGMMNQNPEQEKRTIGMG